MTDLLTQQASIKARNKLVRDGSGRFVTEDAILQHEAATERMRTCLEMDVKTAEHARGVVFEKRHFHALPNTDRLSVEHTAEVLPLFERAIAA